MTFDAHWKRMCDMQPMFREEGDRMTCRIGEFKRMMGRAFDAGGRSVVEAMEAAGDFKVVGQEKDVLKQFADIFGGPGR